MDTSAIIDAILSREGGYEDDPADRGGPTKFGITQATLAAWRGAPVTAEDVKNLSRAEARQIYSTMYVQRTGFASIHYVPLQALIVDAGVQHGPEDATRWLQEAAGVTADGVLGPVTLAAVNAAEGKALYRRVLAARCRYYGELIAHDPAEAKFAGGWAARVATFIEATP